MGNDRIALIHGDNVFYSRGMSAELAEATARADGATVFAYYVSEPSQHGMVKFDKAELSGGGRVCEEVISADDLRGLAARYGKAAYGHYLQRLADE